MDWKRKCSTHKRKTNVYFFDIAKKKNRNSIYRYCVEQSEHISAIYTHKNRWMRTSNDGSKKGSTIEALQMFRIQNKTENNVIQ